MICKYVYRYIEFRLDQSFSLQRLQTEHKTTRPSGCMIGF